MIPICLLKGGKRRTDIKPNTIADGLTVTIGEMNYEILKDKLADIVTVSEESIINTMRLMFEQLKIVVEPSSAVTLAALLDKKIDLKNQRIGLIISGGNVDLDSLPWIN